MWYPLQIDGKWYAQRNIIIRDTGKETKELFRDWNNDVMELADALGWPELWCKTKNEIDRIGR